VEIVTKVRGGEEGGELPHQFSDPLPLPEHFAPLHENLNYYGQEALQMQTDRATRFVSRKYKSDLQAHSRPLVLMPFDRPCRLSISLPL